MNPLTRIRTSLRSAGSQRPDAIHVDLSEEVPRTSARRPSERDSGRLSNLARPPRQNFFATVVFSVSSAESLLSAILNVLPLVAALAFAFASVCSTTTAAASARGCPNRNRDSRASSRPQPSYVCLLRAFRHPPHFLVFADGRLTSCLCQGPCFRGAGRRQIGRAHV